MLGHSNQQTVSYGYFENKSEFDSTFKENFILGLNTNANGIIINNLNYSIIRDFKIDREKILKNFTLSKDNWMTIQLLNHTSFSNFKDRQVDKLKTIIKRTTGYKLNERIISIANSILKTNGMINWVGSAQIQFLDILLNLKST